MLTQERLRELLHYDPETGVFTWRRAKGSAMFGRQAGTLNNRGYIIIWIDCKPWAAHRLAFLYMTGQAPKLHVDHINRDSSDNRWVNLREATRSGNMGNCKVRHTSRSGVKGVRWEEKKQKWRARIQVNRRTKHLGYYNSLQEAAAAYDAAARRHYGKFAATNETLGTISSSDGENGLLVPPSPPLSPQGVMEA